MSLLPQKQNMPSHERLNGEMTQKRDFHSISLPQVHHSQSLSYGSRTLSTTSSAQSFGSKPKLGLGVNAQTGRLQWCPGFTCCKLLIIIPVIMLPITLVLILLMRMDGMLMALQMHQHHHRQQHRGAYDQEPPLYLEDYEGALDNDPYQDMISEQLLIPRDKKIRLSEEERIKRCISFRFGLSETIDVEDRDIMKDARTSFLPQDTTVIPRECLDNFNVNPHLNYNDFDLNALLESYGRRRFRRENAAEREEEKELPAAEEVENQELNESSTSLEDSPLVASTETTSLLQSFWNEQGTKESMRETQAKTMKQYMNTSVEPCDDFYQYVCGNWEKHHPIPKDKAGFDTFEMLRENLDIVLRELLESRGYDKPESADKKIQHIVANTYDQLPNTQADIVNPLQTENVEEDKEKEKLVQHLVEERGTLGQLIMRYKRGTLFTNTKRKRFTGHHNSSESQFAYNLYRPKSPYSKSPSLQSEPSSDGSNDAQLKARHLYQSCTNIRLLEERGVQPLLDLVESLGGWPVLNENWNADNFDWLNLTAHLRRYNNDILIVQWVGPDIKNSDENIIQFDQTNLGLPTREYYLQDINAKYLHAYQRFMTDVLHKLGANRNKAVKTAADLISFETQLASITAPAEKRLNVTKLYKRMTLSDLHDLIPQIDWVRYLTVLQQRNVQDSEQVVIYATEYMQDLVNLLDRSEPELIANYLLWRFVRHRINNVDDRFDDTKQTFYHTLFGREESPSRWKVCISQVNTNMGMALGSMFVRKYFDENSKKDTLKMTHELQQAFREILKTTDWLDPQTKHLAELKVNVMSLKIGYPDFILNAEELNEKYAGIEIDPDKYFENTLNVLLHTTRTEQNKLHEPVNKTTWQTAPAIVNAYYSRNKNQIMFPAGILQPPFYHRHFPRSLNFGGIGVVIGHELTHGFDDKGRLFDRNGSIHKWWTDSSIKGFDERARCIIAQYGNYTVGEVGIALNGESTQGENIADNGGIRQAFHAYKKWLQDNPEEAKDEHLPGINMTGEQLFFLNFGQVWCGAMRPEAVRNKLNTAIHSPGRFRVIGTLSNSPDFAKEFNCPLGSPMNPLHKCSVW